jgi:Spy/CpxP family protein refolding chaperone
MKTIASLLLPFFVIGFLNAVEAKGHRKGKGIWKQLDLSKEQKSKLKEIRKSSKDEMKELREKKKAASKAFHTALKNNASDDELRKLHNNMSSIKNQLHEKRFEKMLKSRAILTDAQKSKFAELRVKHWEKKRKHHREEDEE